MDEAEEEVVDLWEDWSVENKTFTPPVDGADCWEWSTFKAFGGGSCDKFSELALDEAYYKNKISPNYGK